MFYSRHESFVFDVEKKFLLSRKGSLWGQWLLFKMIFFCVRNVVHILEHGMS